MTTPVCRFVVSACLAGEFCRYDGGSNACAAVQELVRRGEAVTACPEGLACLPVPRPPCEIREGRVLSQDGRDLTEDFLRGEAALGGLPRDVDFQKNVLDDAQLAGLGVHRRQEPRRAHRFDEVHPAHHLFYLVRYSSIDQT